jgi:hypothetical protein
MSGNVAEEFQSIERAGWADVRARLAFNLLGGPALSPREFAARRPSTTLGTSLVVIAPTGEYDPAKLINISAHRWAMKPELGLSHPAGRFTLEGYAGVWLFTDNADFYGGSRREQAPMTTFQAHVAYTFRPRLWLAGSVTYYVGGHTTLDGVEKQDRQESSRLGLTLATPISRHFSLKAYWTNGVTVRVGGDFTTWGIAGQALWF